LDLLDYELSDNLCRGARNTDNVLTAFIPVFNNNDDGAACDIQQ